MSETNLKPCPFCGGRARYFDGASVGCSNRGCIGYGLPLVQAAEKMGRAKRERMLAEAWNRRAERTCRDIGTYGAFACSECGADLTLDGDGWMLWDGAEGNVEPSFCPCCGAKVVEG